METHLQNGKNKTVNKSNPEGVYQDLGANTFLCNLKDIVSPGGKGFRVGRRERFFIIRKNNKVFGYINICPHQGTPLDWKNDVFLTFKKDYILCATHGAMFEIETGECVGGPCLGRMLVPIKLRVENGKIMLAC